MMRRHFLNICLAVGAILILYCINDKLRGGTDGQKLLKKKNLSTDDVGEIEKNVYRPFGFVISNLVLPLPVLKRIKNETCQQIFTDWLDYVDMMPQFEKPPHEIPAEMMDKFVMHGYAELKTWYMNEMNSGTKFWSKESIEKLVNADTVHVKYPPDGLAIYYATTEYELTDMIGLVVGSYDPWVEAICIRKGASKVYTIDYQNAKTDHPQLQFLNAFEMARNWTQFYEQFDFVISFSSIEHSGLGRYGDPLDPIADLREMQKIRCLLKPGGFLFFGVPVGLDAVVFNVHRVYGRVRLPMMFEGYLLNDIFAGKHKVTKNYLPLSEDSSSGGPQITFVLKKVN